MSPFLFLVYIDDPAQKIRIVMRPFRTYFKGSAIKLVAKDVIILATGEIMMRVLFQICKTWGFENPRLTWKPKKCHFLPISGKRRFNIGNEQVNSVQVTKYLAVPLQISGVVRVVSNVLVEKAEPNLTLTMSRDSSPIETILDEDP